MKSRSLKIMKWTLIGLGGITIFGITLLAIFIKSLFAEPDLSQLPQYHPFKSAKAKERYLAYYDRRAQSWPVHSDTLSVQTRFGSTFIRISGKPGSRNLVLLPSGNASSLIWMQNITSISQSNRVYAIDNIYDIGRSVYTKVMKSPDDFVLWLDDLCDGLSLGDSMNLAGYSYGGWIASNYALKRPQRLARVILVAPAATICPLPAEWAWRGILSVLPHRIFMERLMIDWLFTDLAEKNDSISKAMIDNAINDALMSLTCFKFKMLVAPTVLSDGELRQIKVPMLLLIGEHEKINPPLAAIERCKRLAPAITVKMIKGAGHDLPLVQSEEVSVAIRDFFNAASLR
jgi:pimeloyl-ACP methyl ester carboxylesterase